MALCSIFNGVFVLLLLLSVCGCSLIDGFLIRRHAITTVCRSPTLPPVLLLHESAERGGGGEDKGGKGKGGGRQNNSKRKKRRRRRGPVNVEALLVETKWGRIHRPDLFELFDPSKRNDDQWTIERRIRKLGEVDSEKILTSILNSWARADRARDAGDRCYGVLKHLQEYSAESHLRINVFLYNVIINAYAKRKEASKADSVLKEMLNNQGIEPDVRAFSAVMNAWSKSDEDDAPERCMELLSQMKRKASSSENMDVTPDAVTYTTVIDAYAVRGRAKEAEEVLQEMLNTPGVEPNVRAFSSVMNGWSKSDEDDAPERCMELLSQMKSMSSSSDNGDVVPNTITYTTVIDAYAVRGRAKEAEEVLQEMLDTPGVEPNVRTFNSVMNAWSNSDEDDAPERCKELLSQMNNMASSNDNKDVAPDTVTYNTIIDAYAVRGRAIDTDEVLQLMLNTQAAEPNVRTSGSVMDEWYEWDEEFGPEDFDELFN